MYNKCTKWHLLYNRYFVTNILFLPGPATTLTQLNHKADSTGKSPLYINKCGYLLSLSLFVSPLLKVMLVSKSFVEVGTDILILLMRNSLRMDVYLSLFHATITERISIKMRYK